MIASNLNIDNIKKIKQNPFELPILDTCESGMKRANWPKPNGEVNNDN